MRGAVLTDHGTTDVIQIVDDLRVGDPGANNVRVRVQAVALNRLDIWVRAGWKGLQLDFPHITSADGAGIVDAIGENVVGFGVGDRVAIDPTLVPPPCVYDMGGWENQCKTMAILGEHRPGVAAEYIVVPARNLVKLPEEIDFATAAAGGLVYLTAWHSLITRGGTKPGESVLIIGAGGGVNTASLQIAKLTGCTVYVLGSTDQKCEQAQQLGADHVICRQENPNWARTMQQLTDGAGVDVVVDNVGKATLNHSMRCVRRGGRILCVGGTSGAAVEIDLRYLFYKHISLIGSTMAPHCDYVRVMNLIFAGKLNPVIGAQMPLSAMREAHHKLEAGDIFGKIVLDVNA